MNQEHADSVLHECDGEALLSVVPGASGHVIRSASEYDSAMVADDMRRTLDGSAPLSRALDQSQQIQDKVEQAGLDLALVNAVLKKKVSERAPIAADEQARSSAVELNVQKAAAELVAVNDALALEIGERHHLEDQLSASNTALLASRAEEARSRSSALHDPVTG
ncbi:MAG TPA: hypothetical protein VGC79_01795, partial [Polyangiaceae bacterium]